ncbi:g7433 [Coccomyxa viridis]|uniref:G7433 protein n=1 Tax=Coccomyxa viridis TaxID=1274662 RepID=A0ABP1FXU2_9CHLO
MDDDENSDADSQASGSSGIDHVEYAPQELPEGLEVQVFEDEEDRELLTTAQDVTNGRDPQNIPWDRLQVSRSKYRETRMQSYPNYVNLRDVFEQNHDRLRTESLIVRKDGCRFYNFHQNLQNVRSDIAHFQLRHLLWATSKHDVYTTSEACIMHWSTITQKATKVLDCNSLPGESGPVGANGRAQISTFCARHDLLAAGGFAGELDVVHSHRPGLLCSKRVTTSEMGITNGIDIFQSPSGSLDLLTSNNDNVVRCFGAETFQEKCSFGFEWPVNLAIANPCEGGSSLMIVVGDDTDAFVMDLRTRNHVHRLKGHLDYSFAASWHPFDGHTVATGNQDMCTRVWDLRKPSESSVTLYGRLGAVRSLRYSPDGRLLAASEPADFVQLYDVTSGYRRCQEIDLFGEVGGISFSPDGSSFFVSIADVAYSSLQEYVIAQDWRKDEGLVY